MSNGILSHTLKSDREVATEWQRERDKGMSKQFTDVLLRAQKPDSKDRWLTEGGRRGEGKLLLRVSPDGTKRFYYRMPAGCGTRAPHPLAPYDPAGRAGYTLAKARARFSELEALRREQGNPLEYERGQADAEAAERRRAELERAKQGTLGELLDAYSEKLEREGKRSVRDVTYAFRKHVRDAVPDLLDRKAAEITPADIHRILSRIVAAGHTRQVNKTRSMLLSAFNYAAMAAYDPRRQDGAAAFGIAFNPVTLTKRVEQFERAGDRVLSSSELAAYWRHLDQVPSAVVRGFLRVAMLLGGQRVAQLARLREPDIDPEAGIIRLQDSKGRSGIPRDHLLPLTKRVKEILEAVAVTKGGKETPDAVPVSKGVKKSVKTVSQVEGPTDWIFSSNGRSSLRPETVSVAVVTYSAWLVKNAKVKPFSARDLRRTCETRLAELGISKDIRAQLLSHGISGVQAKHYDRYSYLKEKREALGHWEAYLDGLPDPEQKVVSSSEQRKRK